MAYARTLEIASSCTAFALQSFLLGCILGLVIHYPKRLHACNSRDVIKTTYKQRLSGECFQFTPRVVPCEWHQWSFHA